MNYLEQDPCDYWRDVGIKMCAPGGYSEACINNVLAKFDKCEERSREIEERLKLMAAKKKMMSTPPATQTQNNYGSTERAS